MRTLQIVAVDIKDFYAIKGGPGSGFHGHAGRPGEVGGSAAAGTAPAGLEEVAAKRQARRELITPERRKWLIAQYDANNEKAPEVQAFLRLIDERIAELMVDATSPSVVPPPLLELEFPTENELIAGQWESVDENSSAAGKWVVTTKDGKKWFVKQPSDKFVRQGFNEVDNELAAEVLGHNLDLPVVPVAFYPGGSDSPLAGVLYDAGQPGVLAYPYLEGSKTYARVSQYTDTDKFLSDDDKVKYSLFDFIIKNGDRHKSNFLFTGDREPEPRLIDHSLSFNERSYAEEPFFWEDAGYVPVSRNLVQWLRDGINKSLEQANEQTKSNIAFAAKRLSAVENAFDEMEANNEKAVWRVLREHLNYARA